MIRNQALAYFEALRGHGPRKYQVRHLAAMLRAAGRPCGQTLTVMYPRQAGKNEVAAMYVVALLMGQADRGGNLVVCAPTARPQLRISLNRIRRYAACVTRHTKLKPYLDGNTLALGRATVTFLSASPQAHVAGHTASLGIVVDEAQEVEEEWFEHQFRPMTATTGAPVVLFGTAWDGESLLERAAARNRELDQDRPPRDRRHFQVGWQQVARSLRGYAGFVADQRERLGASHPVYLSQYELVAAEGAGRLFREDHLEALEGTHPRLAGPVKGERYVAGLDVGGDQPDADASVLTMARLVGERCEVVQHIAWQAAPYEQVQSEAIAAIRRWNFERLCVDGVGIGSQLASRLEREFRQRVERFKANAGSKSELGYQLLAAANTGQVALYADDGSPEALACRLELRTCRQWQRAGKRMEWGNNQRHDDYVSSLALCLRAAELAGPPRLAVGRRMG